MNAHQIQDKVKNAHDHNKGQTSRVNRALTNPSSLFRSGVRLIFQGKCVESTKYILPYFTIDGHIPRELEKVFSQLPAKQPILNAMCGLIAQNVKEIINTRPKQCTFMGTKGGSPGTCNFFPFHPDNMCLKTLTTERPQVPTALGTNTVLIDNIFYWKGMQSCITQVSKQFEMEVSRHEQLSSLGYSKCDSFWKEPELKRIEKLSSQFQESSGNEFCRLQLHFAHRLDRVKQGKSSSPFLSDLLSCCICDSDVQKEWEAVTWQHLLDLGEHLEQSPGPTFTTTQELYAVHVSSLFADSNPLMVDVISRTRV